MPKCARRGSAAKVARIVSSCWAGLASLSSAANFISASMSGKTRPANSSDSSEPKPSGLFRVQRLQDEAVDALGRQAGESDPAEREGCVLPRRVDGEPLHPEGAHPPGGIDVPQGFEHHVGLRVLRDRRIEDLVPSRGERLFGLTPVDVLDRHLVQLEGDPVGALPGESRVADAGNDRAPDAVASAIAVFPIVDDMCGRGHIHAAGRDRFDLELETRPRPAPPC